MEIDDFHYLLSTLWLSDEVGFPSERVRCQCWLFELIAAYTASRPGPFVETSDTGATGCPRQVVLYRDCVLALLANDGPGEPTVWILEITFRWAKDRRGRAKP